MICSRHIQKYFRYVDGETIRLPHLSISQNNPVARSHTRVCQILILKTCLTSLTTVPLQSELYPTSISFRLPLMRPLSLLGVQGEISSDTLIISESVGHHSSLKAYIKQPESHEQTVLGQGPSDPKKAIEIRKNQARAQIRQAERKL